MFIRGSLPGYMWGGIGAFRNIRDSEIEIAEDGAEDSGRLFEDVLQTPPAQGSVFGYWKWSGNAGGAAELRCSGGASLPTMRGSCDRRQGMAELVARTAAAGCEFVPYNPPVVSEPHSRAGPGLLCGHPQGKELIVHSSYEIVDSSCVQFIQQAASDQDVGWADQQNVYRTSKDSRSCGRRRGRRARKIGETRW